MVSRKTFLPIPSGRVPTAEDINQIYALLNGDYSATKGWGASVQHTAYDALRSDGTVDLVSYAHEVRNRESTLQRTAAWRRSDNKIVASVEGGLLLAVKDTLSGTSPTQVIVNGTPAGGVLSGTYPYPGFASPEYVNFQPGMTMLWYGSSSVTPRPDGFSGVNLEVTNAPGWIFCHTGLSGASAKMRDGTTLTIPNMTDRLPIGVGTVALGSTGGSTWTSLASLSIAHTHTMPHTHNQLDHTHTQADHTHTQANHTHDLAGHTHTQADHTHTIQHTHDLQNHTHNEQLHTHGTPGHNHTLSGHNHAGNFNWESHTHGPGSINWSHTHALDARGSTAGHSHTHLVDVSASFTTSGPAGINGLATAGGVNLPTTTHTHTGTAVQTGSMTYSMSGAITGNTGDENSTFHTLSGGITSDSSVAGTSSGSTTGSGVDTTASDGAVTTNSQSSVTLALNGPNTNSTGNPVSSGTSGSSSTTATTSNITSGPTSNTSGPSSTTATTNNITSGTSTTPTTSNITSGSSRAGVSNVTQDTNTASTGAASTTTIDPRPPVVGWYYILKL